MDASLSDRNKAHLSDEDKIPVENSHSKVEIPIYNDVERVDQTDLSFAAILKGTAANPLNTFEKKAALINVEIDKFGMGKYQICIWFLCGFGYFLDLAWSQGVGLIASAIYQEVSMYQLSLGVSAKSKIRWESQTKIRETSMPLRTQA
ncbi:hypothetical protein Ptr902_08839 [Pyrenophora tritici-repentis]|nr:hypothetical protein Ptr902_08839 [Pyrenophora tritici-repentis]